MGRAVCGCAQVAAALLGIVGLLGTPSPAAAFNFLEGRLQVHGFYEQQIRTLSRDFDASDDFDLAQWYHVLNVEVDYHVAPMGWGPFDFISMFARFEVRYDCVWTRGCGLFPSADTFGDRASHLPQRLSDARGRGFIGTIEAGDTRRLLGQERSELDFAFKDRPVRNSDEPGRIWNFDGLQPLFAVEGPDGMLETADDPAIYVFERFLDFRFAARKVAGPTGGVGVQMLGPWLPENEIKPIGSLRDRANPFRDEIDAFARPRADGGDVHPQLAFPDGFTAPIGVFGTGEDLSGQPVTPRKGILSPTTGDRITDLEKPFRPAPECGFDQPCAKDQAQGLFYPNPALAKKIREGAFDAFDQNFRQAELEWNRGASQQDEKELKELYFDLELFDSSLWLRVGKQNIVWGKTELFRTTDQFNPQDFALATLPTLEESRIALWAVRGVWSFYDVGFLKDTRVEMAFNWDQFEPVDIGRCGEAFAINLVCLKSLGLFAHGITGIGLAGEERPPDPWQDVKGLEGGIRFEFRIGRVSFQISDFYGYSDFPTLERLFDYERNVDPRTGMPRRAFARGPCRPPADLAAVPDRSDPDCLGRPGSGDVDAFRRDVLLNHPANQTLFALACAASVGFTTLTPDVCGPAALNSRMSPVVDLDPDDGVPPSFQPGGPTTPLLSRILEGGAAGKTALFFTLLNLPPADVDQILLDWNKDGSVTQLDVPLVALSVDPNDAPAGRNNNGVDRRLTREQEALLGCGPFFEHSAQIAQGLIGCDVNGVDLLNAEASALVQAWPGIEGTSGSFWDPFDFNTPQPGTVGFFQAQQNGPVCTRYENGQLFILPGCRGPVNQIPGVSDWDPGIDGNPPNHAVPAAPGPPNAFGIFFGDIQGHPFACDRVGPGAVCQQWATEMAALSWNFMIALVMLSGANHPTADKQARIDFFDPFNSLAEDKCSLARPFLCENVQLVWSALGTRRATVRAGGQNGFGRRDFAWHQGGDVSLTYDKRNVLGFSFDFADDYTKSNWSFELAWVDGFNVTGSSGTGIDNNEFDGFTEFSTYNLTFSVDRPTFINFLNANRTFFFNSQWFFQYVQDYKRGFTSGGPFNVLGTFTVLAGYFQDRLLSQVTFVYDMRSNSGGLLSQLTYRYSERFSATFGVNAFMGRFEPKTAPLNDIVPNQNRVGSGADREPVENLLSLFRDKDELFLILRYTF